MALFDLLNEMDLDQAQRSKLVGIVKESCMTIRSFELLGKEDLIAMGFPHPAVIELKELIKNKAAVVHTPSSANTAETPTSDTVSSTNSNNGTALPVLTVEELRRLTGAIDISSAAGLRELNRVLVAEMIKRQPTDQRLTPCTKTKLLYANLAVEAYPELKSIDSSHPCAVLFKPYYATYENGVRRVHPQCGMLEEHLKSLRAKEKKSLLRNGGTPTPKRAKRSIEVISDPVDMGRLIELFSGECLDYKEKREETIAERRNFLQTKGVVDLDLYLFTVGLDLRSFQEVKCEFQLWVPSFDEKSFSHAFQPMVSKIVLVAESEPPRESMDKLTTLRAQNLSDPVFALRALPLLLPVKQSVGKEKRFTNAELFTNARNAFIVDIPDIGNLEWEACEHKVGTILCSNTQVFVVGPKSAIMVANLFEAVDLAFRLFYIVNLKYPEAASVVWSFIQMAVFKVASGSVPNQVDAFLRQMKRVEMDKEN